MHFICCYVVRVGDMYDVVIFLPSQTLQLTRPVECFLSTVT
jgi:hypothetical protein